ncbi:MAG TPA: GNAT family N-acetyltransferase [Gemmatimonadaceae bacterium]|nr:GNAT family N-acetyltransferase [Gemmatimonadaceae bacterium]
MTITVRCAAPSDQDYSCVAARIPPAVVTARIVGRNIAVAELDGRPVGALHLEYLWGTRPYVALIRVDSAAQRQGVGRALLAFISSDLASAGHQQLFSSSQADEAEPQAWHRHMGFVECGFIAGINAGGVGEVFFVKRLSTQVSE